MGSDLFEVMMDSTVDPWSQKRDSLMLLFKFSPVPRNSGAQNVAPHLVRLMNRAARLRPPLRNLIMQMAKEPIYGYVAIGAEGGFNSKELNTHRSEYNAMSVNTGPGVTPLDEYVNGRMPNNPRNKKDDLAF